MFVLPSIGSNQITRFYSRHRAERSVRTRQALRLHRCAMKRHTTCVCQVSARRSSSQKTTICLASSWTPTSWSTCRRSFAPCVVQAYSLPHMASRRISQLWFRRHRASMVVVVRWMQFSKKVFWSSMTTSREHGFRECCNGCYLHKCCIFTVSWKVRSDTASNKGHRSVRRPYENPSGKRSG